LIIYSSLYIYNKHPPPLIIYFIHYLSHIHLIIYNIYIYIYIRVQWYIDDHTGRGGCEHIRLMSWGDDAVSIKELTVEGDASIYTLEVPE
jgi:hypothetical protein